MAALVSFLAAGVAGAESGSATFTVRSTGASAASNLWDDFEETSQPGTNVITLDSNGSAEVYTDTIVNVELKDSGGSTIRTVTFGTTADIVEVVSDSFTGTPYGGGGSAASEPTTLGAILDLWNNSSGALDWEAVVSGSSTQLQSAIAAFSGMFINVQDPAYGATGDGVTDDSAAIDAAIAAAAGAGLTTSGAYVYFPPGIYNVESTGITVSTAYNITIMGASRRTSVISMNNGSATHVFSFTNGVSGAEPSFQVYNMTFQGGQAETCSVIICNQFSKVFIANCMFNTEATSNLHGPAIESDDSTGNNSVHITDCIFNIGSTSIGDVIQNNGNDGSTFISIKGCKFISTVEYTGECCSGPDMSIVGCLFDFSNVASSEYTAISLESNQTDGLYRGVVSGCIFLDGGSAGHAFNFLNNAGSLGPAAGSNFSESGNTFIGFTEPAAATDVGIVGQYLTVQDISNTRFDINYRKNRVLEYTIASGTASVSISAHTDAETIIITFQNNATFTVSLASTSLIPGESTTVVVVNDSGSANDVVFTGDEGETLSSVPDGDHAVGFYRMFNVSSTSVVAETIHSYQD